MGGRGGGRSGGGGGGLMPLPPHPGLPIPEPVASPARLMTLTTIRMAYEKFRDGVDIGKFDTQNGVQNITLQLHVIGTSGKEYQMLARSADGRLAGEINFRVKGDVMQNSWAKTYKERTGLGGKIYERVVS